MYTYIESEPGLYTVGTYDSGEWEPESDHTSRLDAKQRVAELNGGGVSSASIENLQQKINELQREIAEMSGQINNLSGLIQFVAEAVIPDI